MSMASSDQMLEEIRNTYEKYQSTATPMLDYNVPGKLIGLLPRFRVDGFGLFTSNIHP
jgi:hypothetical protein